MNPNKPSATAFFVAAGLHYQLGDRRWKALAPKGLEKWSEYFLQVVSPLSRNFSHSLLKRIQVLRLALLERFSIKGIYGHFLLRKRYLDDRVRECLRRGAKQIVVLGAGFDTLLLRLESEGITCRYIEIDHPVTQAYKLKKLDQKNHQSNIRYEALDLSSGSFEAGLNALPSINPTLPTVFVLEGILMYLKPEAVEKIWESLSRLMKLPYVVLFTYMEGEKKNHFQFHGASLWVRLWLAIKKENFYWGLAAGELKSFCSLHGLSILEEVGEMELRRLYLKELGPLPLASGEKIAWVLGGAQ
jgi:methyltransferase (TIGR00027 family)